MINCKITPESSNTSKMSTGVLIGIIIGSLVVFVCIVFGIHWLKKYLNKKKN